MCCCMNKSKSTSATEAPAALEAIVVRVDDMACGHCAQVIKTSVEATLPGTEARPDPARKTVTVCGTTDLTAVRRAIASTGYTPSPMS